MADDKSKRGSPDSKRIDTSDPNEIRYWTKALGVTEQKLREAVAKVGTGEAAIRRYLGK